MDFDYVLLMSILMTEIVGLKTLECFFEVQKRKMRLSTEAPLTVPQLSSHSLLLSVKLLFVLIHMNVEVGLCAGLSNFYGMVMFECIVRSEVSELLNFGLIGQSRRCEQTNWSV